MFFSYSEIRIKRKRKEKKNQSFITQRQCIMKNITMHFRSQIPRIHVVNTSRSAKRLLLHENSDKLLHECRNYKRRKLINVCTEFSNGTILILVKERSNVQLFDENINFEDN